MGFWDFIAPDFEKFREVLLPVVPEALVLGPVVLSDEDLIAAAWVSPASGAGLALRTYYASSTFQVARPLADAIWGQIEQQAQAGRFGAGPGVGGSFEWKAVPSVVQIIIPSVYRVAIEGVSAGQVVTNVVGVRGASSGQEVAATTAVRTAWKVATGPLSQLTNLYALTGFRGMDLSSANGGISFIADTTTGGAGAAPKSTMAASALVKWNGGTRSRSSRGRLYFGPLSEAQIDVDGRTVASAARTAIETAFNAFRTSIQASGFTLCVISPTLQTAFDVTSLGVESIIATQRRRIRG